MKHKVIALILALLTIGFPAAVHAAPLASPLPPECMEWYDSGGLHHQLSQWTIEAVQGGNFRAWKLGTNVVIVFQVAACGGAWMFAKFRGQAFVTNFFPSKGMNYISTQVRGYGPVALKLVRAAVISAASYMEVLSMLVTPIMIRKDILCQYGISVRGLYCQHNLG